MDTTLIEFVYGKALFDRDQIVVNHSIQVYYNEDFLFVSELEESAKYQMTPKVYEQLQEICFK